MNIHWVSVDGSDTAGNGSRDNPYATLEKALNVFQNGDQIRLLPGSYIPVDSVVISGLDGSIFAEDPQTVYIQPEKTRIHQACIAILGSSRFLIQGVNILQAADTSGNLIGLYVENVDTFLAYTCSISDFEVPSGNACGIFASGSLGRVERCSINNVACAGGTLHGIRTIGLDVIDCEVSELSGAGNCQVRAITLEGSYNL